MCLEGTGIRSEVRRLLVRVDDGLILDAGGWFEVRDEDGATWRQVEPPARMLFDQLVDHLGKLPPEPRYTGLRLAEEAAAATALCRPCHYSLRRSVRPLDEYWIGFKKRWS